jgi:ParB-like chromosome segregation protein Spo0J
MEQGNGSLLKSAGEQKVRVRARTLNKRTGPVVQPAHTETRKTGSKIAAAVQQAEPAAHEQVYEIPLSQIQPDPHQHRKTFPADTMRELADSIKETGGNRTPIVVRRVEGPGKVQFQIIAGERRYRALKQNKMPVARAVIRENVTDEDALLEQVIENLNRLNVTPTEEATAYRQLADGEIARAKRRKEWRGADLKDIAAQEKLEALGRNYAAAKSGKQKSRVDYYIVLTDLPEEARDMVDKGHLTTAHAHALLRLTDYKEDSRNLDPKFRKERVLHLGRMARHARANSGITAKILNGMVTEYIRANQQQAMFSDDEVTGGEKQVRRQAQKAKLAKLLDAVVSAIGQSWDDDTQEFQADAMSAADLQLAMGQIDGAMDSFGKIKDVFYREMLAREAQEATKRRVVREDAAEDGASSPQPRGLSLFKAILATLRGNHG